LGQALVIRHGRHFIRPSDTTERQRPTRAAGSDREVFGDPPAAPLFPEDERAVARAVGKRRREFATARFYARTALARLGLDPAPIVPGPRGEPGWPAGVVGSMTHCAGYRAAAVARAEDVLTIGVDAEPDEPLPEVCWTR